VDVSHAAGLAKESLLLVDVRALLRRHLQPQLLCCFATIRHGRRRGRSVKREGYLNENTIAAALFFGQFGESIGEKHFGRTQHRFLRHAPP
jgi:hypothetical protein